MLRLTFIRGFTLEIEPKFSDWDEAREGLFYLTLTLMLDFYVALPTTNNANIYTAVLPLKHVHV